MLAFTLNLKTTLLLDFTASASAEIIGVEQFDYVDGAIAAKTGGTFWDYKNAAPVGHTLTASNWDNLISAPAVASRRLVTNISAAKREYNGFFENDGPVNGANVAKTVYYRVNWTPNPGGFEGDGNPMTLSLGVGGSGPQFFIRLRVVP